MKKIIKVLAVLVSLLVIIAAVPAFIPDEEYLPGVTQWLKEANTPENIPDEVNRFNAIAGFNVAADKDMVTEGAKLVAEVNALFDETTQADAPVEFNDYWNNPPLLVKAGLHSEMTSAFEENPAQWLSENNDVYSESISSNQVLLDRFRKLMSMNQYSYTIQLDVNAPYISYRDFISIKGLNNLSIINEFTGGNKQSAMQRLQGSIAFSKLMMKQSVMLLDKMVATALLKNDLKTYSSLLDLSPTDAASAFPISNLIKEESDMLKAIRGEFAYMSPMLDFEKSKKFNVTESNALQDFFAKHYFKRKKMENHAYKNTYRPFLELDELALAERKNKMASISVGDESWWRIYQDPVGYILSAIAIPSYFQYIDRVDHVDAMISLLNLKASIYSDNVSSDEIENYISSLNAAVNTGYTGAIYSWDKDKQELSYSIPEYVHDDVPGMKLDFNRPVNEI